MSWKNLPRSSSAPLDRQAFSSQFSVRPRELRRPRDMNVVLWASRLRGNERRKDCSHHLLHPAPGLERRPDAPFKPETIDRRRRLDRVDAIQTDAGPLESAL